MAVTLWPALGLTVLDAESTPIPESGIVLDSLSAFYQSLVRRGLLLTYNPASGGDPEVQLPRVTYQYVSADGMPLTSRETLDFVGGTVEDDAENDRTRVTLGGGSSGLPYSGVEEVATQTYTFVLEDAGKLKRLTYTTFPFPSMTTVEIPLHSSVPFDVGTVLSVIGLGGQAEWSGAIGVTYEAPNGRLYTLRDQGAITHAVQTEEDVWWIYGDLAAES